MGRWLTVALILLVCCTADAVLSDYRWLEVDGRDVSRHGDDPLEVELGELVTISVHSSRYQYAYGAWLQLTDDVHAEWVGSLQILPAAGLDARVKDWSHIDSSHDGYSGLWWYFDAKSFDPANRVQAGKHFEIQTRITSWDSGASQVCVNLWDYEYRRILDSVSLMPVSVSYAPEPASVTLMTLGALALLQKRRAPQGQPTPSKARRCDTYGSLN